MRWAACKETNNDRLATEFEWEWTYLLPSSSLLATTWSRSPACHLSTAMKTYSAMCKNSSNQTTTIVNNLATTLGTTAHRVRATNVNHSALYAARWRVADGCLVILQININGENLLFVGEAKFLLGWLPCDATHPISLNTLKPIDIQFRMHQTGRCLL